MSAPPSESSSDSSRPSSPSANLSVRSLAHWRGFLPEHAVVMARVETPGDVSITDDAPSVPGESLPPSPSSLEQIARELAGCTRCKLCERRKKIVLGEGNPRAELVFIGEGPGEQEDIQGRPFIGNAGQLLDKMIEAMGLSRADVFIANVVKCRPPGNRNPEPEEIATCSPFLYRQLDAIQPKIIVALGKFAAQTLLQTEERISSLRGRFFDYRGAKLMPTFHPAFLLRNPESKREAWSDLQSVAKELGLTIPARRG